MILQSFGFFKLKIISCFSIYAAVEAVAVLIKKARWILGNILIILSEAASYAKNIPLDPSTGVTALKQSELMPGLDAKSAEAIKAGSRGSARDFESTKSRPHSSTCIYKMKTT